MECISISYKTAEAGERGLFSFPGEEAAHFLDTLMAQPFITQCVFLSTCNRTEVYVQGEQNCFGRLEELLAGRAGAEVEKMRAFVRRYQGKRAVRHLFSVTCGMDSMVVGEDEILGQVREAYRRSADAGYLGYELHTVFQAALACAKKVKTKTELSKTSVSVATLAANEVFHLQASPKTVLLIGSSGQIGGIVLKNLLSKKDVHVIATTRTHQGLYQDGSGRVQNVAYRDRYAYLEEADAVISATASPHYTITLDLARQAVRTAKERLYLDLSVPADIDEGVAGLAGARRIGLDDFADLARQNNLRKQQAVLDAGEILEREAETLSKVLLFHRAQERLGEWKERYGACPLEKLLYKLRDELDSGAFAAVLEALDRP